MYKLKKKKKIENHVHCTKLVEREIYLMYEKGRDL